MSDNQTKTWLSDFLLLTLLITILFGSFLGTRPLAVPDEGRYAEIPREMVVSGDYVTPRINYIKYFEKPPLVYWMEAGAIKLFGLNEWSLRLATALMALLGCLMTYCAARQLYGRLSAWLASLALSTSLLYFVMARFITLDMTLSVLLAGCLFSFILGTRKPPGKQRNIYLWSMYFFSALAVLTKGLIGIVFPGAIIFIWMLIFNDWRNLKTYCLPTGIALWLILVLPWHILVQQRNPEFFHFYIIEEHFARYLTQYANRAQPLWYLPVFLLLGFAPWIVFLPQAIKMHWPKSWQRRFEQKEAIFLLIWAVFIYIFFSLSQSQLPPYILPIFPAFAVLVGHYLAVHWQQRRQKGIGIGLIIISIILLIALLAGIFLLEVTYPIPKFSLAMACSSLLAILTIVIPLLAYHSKGVKYGISILLITFALFLISLTPSYLPLEQKSIKPLALILKTLITPNAEVVNYHNYYQDLPFYLQRRVVIIGWGNSELDFGMQHQNMDGWLLDDSTFWSRWQSPIQMFMFLSQSDYNSLLKNQPDKNLCLVAATPRNVLVTNQVVGNCRAPLQLHRDK